MSTSRRPVDLDRLADFVGGALDGTPDATEVRHLIADDPDWAEAYTDVAAADSMMSAELGALGTTDEVMPADVVTRLDRVLLAAPAPRAAPHAADAPVTGSSHRPGPPRRPSGDRTVTGLSGFRSRRRRAALATAAAVLVCGAGSVVAVPFLRGMSADDMGTSGAGLANGDAAAPAHGQVPAAVLASGRDHQPGTLGSVPWTRLAATGTGVPMAASVAPGAAEAESRADNKTQPDRAGDHGPAGGATPDVNAIPAELSRLAQPAAREACLGLVVAQYGGHVIVTDYARFSGRPALTVAIRGASQASADRILTVVVGPACGEDATTTDELYHAVV